MTSKIAAEPAGRRSETVKDRKYVILRLWKYLYRYKWLLALAFVLTITGNLFGLIGPLLSGYAIDAIVGPGDVDFPKVHDMIVHVPMR